VIPWFAHLVERLLSPVSKQGLLALTATQLSGFLVFLILYQYLYKEVKPRFLRYWIVAWILMTATTVTGLAAQLSEGSAERAAIEGISFAALCYMLASVLEYERPGRSLYVPWLIGVFGTAATAAIASWGHGAPIWVAAIPPVVGGCVLLACARVIWLTRKDRQGHGATLLSLSLLAAGLHHMGRPMWSLDQLSWVRAAFSDLLQLPLGLGMAVLVLETARRRVTDLNDKLRRLTQITAATAQSLRVDEVLKEALQQLVASMNATHGIVRVPVGQGEGLRLETRVSVGFGEEYYQKPLSGKETWVRGLLDQSLTCVSCGPNLHGPLRPQMQKANLAAMAAVRLPGKDGALGLLTVGSSTPREFQPDELNFLVSVGNLLGLTIQNLSWFEHVSNAQRQWTYTFDSIADPILVHDAAGKILRTNLAFAERLSRPIEALPGWSVADVMAREGKTWTKCPYCELAAGRGDTVDPVLGGYLLASSSEFHDQEGNTLGTVHVLKDITERQLVEEKYRSLVENVQEGVFISTPEGRFVDFNDAFLRMLGYSSREELLKVQDIAASIYVNPEDRGRLKAILADHGAVSDFEFQLRRRDGEILTVLESSIATRDAMGNILGYQGFVLDITERKRAEQEIRRRNRELMVLNSIGQTLNQPLSLPDLLEKVLQQATELFSVDLGLIFLFQDGSGMMNRSAAAGLRSHFAHGFPPIALPDDLLEHIRAVHATVLSAAGLPLPPVIRDMEEQEGLQSAHLVMLWSKDRPMGFVMLGSRRSRELASAELNLLAAVGNQVAGAVEKLLLLNETRRAYEDLRRTQEQLLQSEKMAAIGQLISGVAHELNNPLTAILGYSQLLASSEFVNERGAEYIQKVYKQARRTHRIVSNLLSFARQQKPQRMAINVNQVLEDTIGLRDYDLRVNNIEVHREFASHLPLLFADTHQLQQVFLNILNNSVDAILERSDRGEIWVRTEHVGQRVVVEIVDSGPGVQDPHRVFDPFYTTKPVGKGTGLGLSICYGIVTEHGGEISVQNVLPRGAAFVLMFPITPTNGAAHKDAAPKQSAAQGKVLLVDDEEPVLGLEKEILTSRGILTVMARTGQEAIEILSRETVDLIVTDMKMPGTISGRSLYDWVCHHQPDLAHRMIFTMSDASHDPEMKKLHDAGVIFLQKPFELEAFWNAVQRKLSQPEPAGSKR
jgi:PAS domain S-box-containing protein